MNRVKTCDQQVLCEVVQDLCRPHVEGRLGSESLLRYQRKQFAGLCFEILLLKDLDLDIFDGALDEGLYWVNEHDDPLPTCAHCSGWRLPMFRFQTLNVAAHWMDVGRPLPRHRRVVRLTTAPPMI